MRMIMKIHSVKFFSATLAMSILICCKNDGDIEVEHLSLYNYTETSVADFFKERQDDVTTVHLDSSSLFGMGYIDQAMMWNDELFLLDWSAKKLVSYDLNGGSPLAVYGRRGRAMDEYLQITGFDVDFDGNVWILDSQSDKLIQYDHDGHFQCKHQVPFDALDLKCISNNLFVFAVLPVGKNPKNQDRLIVSDAEFKNSKSLLRYKNNFDVNTILSMCSFSSFDDSSFFCNDMYIDDYVINIDFGGTVNLRYYLDFGGMAFPEEYRSNITLFQKCFGQCRCVCPPVKITDRYCIGNMFNKGLCSFFVADKIKGIMYISDDNTRYKLVGSNADCVIFYCAESGDLLIMDF